jgi:hypothetical protein
MRFAQTAASLVFVVLGSSWAQPAPPPPSALQPAPDFERLRFFEGTWVADDQPAQVNYLQTCAWLPESRRHMVCTARFQRSGQQFQTMAVYTFDTFGKEYVLHQFGESGGSNVLRGNLVGEAWHFSHEYMQGKMKVRLRARFEPTADGGLRRVDESAADDGPWSRSSEFVARRAPAPK